MKGFTNTIILLWQSSKGYFVFTFLLSICSSAPEIINLIVWKKILDIVCQFLINRRLHAGLILGYLFLHFLLKIAESVLNRVNQYIKTMYSLEIEKHVTNEVIDTIQFMQLSDLENAEIHNTVEKAITDSGGKIMSLLSKLVNLLQDITIFVGMSGILISFDFKVYLFIFLSVVPMAVYSQKYFKKIFKIYNRRFEKVRFSNELKKMLSRSDVFKEILMFNNISYFKTKINKILDDMIAEDKKTKKQLNMQGMISETIELFFTYGLKIVIILSGVRAKDTIGTINMNMDSATRLQSATSSIIYTIISMYEDCLYLLSFTKLLAYKKEIIKEQGNRVNKIKQFQIKTIQLKGVWFRYTESSDYIIKDFSFKFEAGKSYAIVGYNGSGKSTVIKLIMGLYEPQKGIIFVNGKPLKEYDLEMYRKQVSAVFQDFVKYPFTVRENIAMGCITDVNCLEKIQYAAEQACASEFVQRLPNQYEEKLVRGWENSLDLSIGQWQRIAIARANMRAAEVFFFDEPSAALDAKTENKILMRAIHIAKEKIVIIITHRFLNIRKVDEIIVLKDGIIDAVGKHEELLRQSQVYSELYYTQKEMI